LDFKEEKEVYEIIENKFTKTLMPHNPILLAKKIDHDIIISFQQRWQNGSKLSPDVISKYPE